MGKLKSAKKIPVECYSRVVGYFRPTSQWNKGKQSEMSDRVTFDINKIEKFISK